MGACEHTSSLGKGAVILPWRMGLKDAHPPISFFPEDSEKCRECALLILKGSRKYKPEQVSPRQGCPPPALGILLGEVELATSLCQLEQLPSSREPMRSSTAISSG